MDELVEAPFNVTCHTAGCGNAEYTIQVLASSVPPAEPYVMCGVCFEVITDVIPVTP